MGCVELNVCMANAESKLPAGIGRSLGTRPAWVRRWFRSTAFVAASTLGVVNHAADFPATSNPQLSAKRVDFGNNATLRDHALSPDRKQIFALVEVLDAGGVAWIEAHALDGAGTLLRRQRLRKAEPGVTGALFFTDQNELVWDNGRYFHFIDPLSLSAQSLPQCRQQAYPLRTAHEEKAQLQATAWHAAEMKQLTSRYGLTANEVVIGNKKIPADFWSTYRKLKDDSALKVESFIAEAYHTMIATLATQSEPLTGLSVDNAQATQHYARLRAQGNTWYCDLGSIAGKYSVRWSKVDILPGSNSKNPFAPLTAEKDALKDGDLTVTVLKRNKTSTYAQDLVAPLKIDTELEFNIRRTVSRFTVKDTRLQIARNHAVLLSNGSVVVRHRDALYLLPLSAR
jgi:hypothetical protein